MSGQRIHQNQPVLTSGTALDQADAAVILMHGRGGTAQDMLGLAQAFPQGKIAYLAPQADSRTWYPNSGFVPIENNEPYVSSAFQTVADLLSRAADAGLPAGRIVLGGFSQGACLAVEFAARHPRRYGGLYVLSGALMGPVDMRRQYSGSLEGTPVFIGGADHDSWVTEKQLRLTAQVLEEMGGVVSIEVQPGREHTVRQTEIVRVSGMISALAQQQP